MVDLDLPVGLVNLRNTCYLNSILQYFYSVNLVRELVSEDLPSIEPTEENLRNILRVTSTNQNNSSNAASDQSAGDAGLEAGRAFVGYECKYTFLLNSVWSHGRMLILDAQSLANCPFSFVNLMGPVTFPSPQGSGSQTPHYSGRGYSSRLISQPLLLRRNPYQSPRRKRHWNRPRKHHFPPLGTHLWPMLINVTSLASAVHRRSWITQTRR